MDAKHASLSRAGGDLPANGRSSVPHATDGIGMEPKCYDIRVGIVIALRILVVPSSG